MIEETAAIGTYVWGKKNDPVPQKVEPIIDQGLFDVAQRVRDLRDLEEEPGKDSVEPSATRWARRLRERRLWSELPARDVGQDGQGRRV